MLVFVVRFGVCDMICEWFCGCIVTGSIYLGLAAVACVSDLCILD